MTTKTVALSFLAICCSAAQIEAQPAVNLKPFLKKHCIRCHGQDEESGDRRFDQLSFDFTKPKNGELLQEVLDQLNLGQMPLNHSRRQRNCASSFPS